MTGPLVQHSTADTGIVWQDFVVESVGIFHSNPFVVSDRTAGIELFWEVTESADTTNQRISLSLYSWNVQRVVRGVDLIRDIPTHKADPAVVIRYYLGDIGDPSLYPAPSTTRAIRMPRRMVLGVETTTAARVVSTLSWNRLA